MSEAREPSSPPTTEAKTRNYVPISTTVTKNPWGKCSTSSSKKGAIPTFQEFPSLEKSSQLTKRELKEMQAERIKKNQEEEHRKMKEEESKKKALETKKESEPQKILNKSSVGDNNFRRDYNGNRQGVRRKYRGGGSRRGRGNRNGYRTRGRGGFRGRGGHKRNHRDHHNMHAMNFNQYYPPYLQAQPMPYPGYYIPMQAPNAQAQMAIFGMYANEMQGMYPMPGMQNVPQLAAQPGNDVEGTSEQPDNATDDNVGKNDENESNGETKSVSDPGTSSSASSNISSSALNAGNSSFVIPKNVVNGVVVVQKPMQIIQKQNEVEVPEGPYLSLVVECVATGTKHTDRAVAHVALVDEDHAVKLNVYVKPKEEIVSYLKVITQLDKEPLDKYGLEPEEAMKIIKECIPPNAVLVGHNIGRHITRLGLKKGVNYRDSLDLADCWRVWNQNFSDYTKFSLNHESSVLLKLRSSGHVPNDAILQMRILQLYLKERDNPEQLHTRRRELMSTPVEKAIHKRFPIIDGVCVGLRKNCKCGAPFIDWTS